MIWFYLDGEDSRDYGIYLRKLPEIVSTQQDIEIIEIPGSEEPLTMDHGGYKGTEIVLECYIKDIANIGAANGFLSGNKKLIISANENRYYNAVFKRQNQSDRLARSMKAWEMEVPVYLKPFRYFNPEPETVEITESGTGIVNPGSADSAPKITVLAYGNITLMIGQYIMEFEGLNGGIIIDSGKKKLLNMDGITIALDQDIEEFPALVPGMNYVKWQGSVQSLTIDPRWRDR